MLKWRPKPASLTPILPTTPNSVNSRTVRPARGCSSTVTAPSRRWSYQSHVCSVRGGPPAGGATAKVEHSPRAARPARAVASSSVRAFSAASCHSSRPAPSATAAISTASAGAHASTCSKQADAIAHCCAADSPAASNSLA